jgi:acetyl-CoA synthetase
MKYEPITTSEAFEEARELATNEPEKFWGKIANSFIWHKPWDKVCNNYRKISDAKWFINGKFNITENSLDRHLKISGDKTALIWIPNNPDDIESSMTYRELHEEVCKYANVLKRQGVKKGDIVCIYLPMIPQAIIAILAVARIGAIHSVVFSGFSAKALRSRIIDAKSKYVITTDVLNRGKLHINLFNYVNEAVNELEFVEKIFVFYRNSYDTSKEDASHKFINLNLELQEAQTVCEPTYVDSEDILFLLYTSGSTGKPKGILHSAGGYMVYAQYSFSNVFQPKTDDVFWCTADIGWITGHTYVTYGPLLSGLTTVIFEGIPTYPDSERYWSIIEKNKVNTFYTAPTAIRQLMAFDTDFVHKYDLSSLKVLGSVGEPINQEAWEWFSTHVGKNRCPIVDTWWQTETGGILISNLANVTDAPATYAGKPLPGISPILLGEDNAVVSQNGIEGQLFISKPWPAMIKGILGDDDRFQKTYFPSLNNFFCTGDEAKYDEHGNIRIIGRFDDVINVAGHRFGSAELENVINSNENVIESAVVGNYHPIKGEGIFVFVMLKHIFRNNSLEETTKSIERTIETLIGRFALPEQILFVQDLPKTRSGKIMRRILKKILHNDFDNLGDVSTLLNPESIESIIKKYREKNDNNA